MTCNGITKTWTRTSHGAARMNEPGGWERENFSDGINGMLDSVPVLDLMYECGDFEG